MIRVGKPDFPLTSERSLRGEAPLRLEDFAGRGFVRSHAFVCSAMEQEIALFHLREGFMNDSQGFMNEDLR